MPFINDKLKLLYESAAECFPEDFRKRNANLLNLIGDSISNQFPDKSCLEYNLRAFYRSLRSSMAAVNKDPEGIAAMVERYGWESIVLFKSWGNEVMDLERKHQRFLSRINQLKSSEDFKGEAFRRLPLYLLDQHSPDLEAIAKNTGKKAALAFENLPQDLMKEQARLLVALSSIFEEETGAAYSNLPREVAKKYPQRLLSFAERYGKASATIFYRFRDEILEIEEKYGSILDELKQIAEAYTTTPGSLFSLISEETLETYGAELVELARQYGCAAPSVFGRFGPEGLFKLNKSTNNLPQKVRDELGILFIHRYVSGDSYVGFETSLLEEVLKNFREPEHNKNTPVALLVYNQNDPNKAFERERKILEPLTTGYKLFIVEVDEKDAAFQWIERIAKFHGINSEGKPNKPIELLMMGGHGTKYSLNLGKEPYYSFAFDRRTIMVEDKYQFERCSEYLADGSIIVLNSCSTGKGGRTEENLAVAIKDALPQSLVYAPMVDTNLCKYNLGETGTVVDVEFQCDDSKKLVLR